MEQNNYKFDIPANENSIIKVIGVGGGGSNAVNHMFDRGIKDVEFFVCNTDIQALSLSSVPAKLQIGTALTEGLGAGANPEKGREAALESKEDIRDLLSLSTRMLFITAGMGGGTGTGAAPIIAEIARELGVLTVAIVTAPFAFEGKKKRKHAENGINQLKQHCDTVLVISNDKLREIYGNLKMSEAFAQADSILTTAAKGIAEIITVPGYVNVDFEDVKTVMRDSGAAVMGSAKTEGENRALRAAQEALNSPLLNNRSIHGSQKVLLSIMSGETSELQMDELTDITDYIQDQIGEDADLIFGNGIDPALGDCISVTIIATGFKGEERLASNEPKKTEPIVQNTPITNTPATPVINTPVVESTPPPMVNKAKEEVEERNVVFNLNGNSQANTPKKVEEPKIEEPSEPQRVIYDLDDDASEEDPISNVKKKDLTDEPEDINTPQVEQIEIEKQEEPPVQSPPLSEIDLKRQQLIKQADERINKLKKLSKNFENEGFKDKIDVPAYLRRGVKLVEPPHSSENNISRYNINDENEILGNNKFFTDKTD
ncbi:cell division protein FtsZ [Microscilla marina]|uniref:Cell division protein FtsZ n=1 Tax=Microscilla marina ATCC 23134 TaxID=313606 RepID=A1ZIZ2_MICM2|nr:cell division protein FtsZ [Microscilla marina]EAY29528.1 cell division protein FtsZ [Microscilla marina ATCC 23134]